MGSRTDAENYLAMVREHPEWNLEIVDVISASRRDVAVRGIGGNLYPTIEQ